MANDREFIIQPLINEGKVVTLADIDPTTAYAQIGVWQANQSKSASAENSYPSYAIPLSELISSGGTPITLNVIPRGTGPSIADGTWQFSGNSIIPITTGSAIGDATHRVGTIFLSSIIDYAGDIRFISGGLRATLTTAGDLGVGVTPTGGRVHIAGVDAGVNFALNVEDNAAGSLLRVRNDGLTFFGQENAYIFSSAILSPGEMNIFNDQLLVLDSSLTTVTIEANNKPLRFNTWHGGAANNIVEFAGRSMAGFESYVHTLDVDFPLISGFKTYIGSTAVGDDTTFRHCFPFGNVHIGYDEASSAGTTKLTIRSRNALAAESNLVLQDNLLATLLNVRNNGSINAPLLPSSGTGLPPGGTVSGDLWIDTLDNTVKRVP